MTRHRCIFTVLPGLLAMLLLLSACDITELNENPNQPTDPNVNFLFTNAINSGPLDQERNRRGFASNYWDDFNLGRFAILYAQYWSQNQYTAESRYDFPYTRSSSVDAMWEDYYLALNDLQEVIRINREDPEDVLAFGSNDNQIAMAQVLQVFIWQVMTDIWGPVPFTAALAGAENASPEYTAQSELYPALLDTLDAAIARIDPTGTAQAEGDIIYGGDMSQWLKFANALRMRVAIRMIDRVPDRACQAINASIQSGTFESNLDNALVPFLESNPYQNPIYVNNVVEGRDDWAVSEPLVDLMTTYQDPRLPIYADTAPDGTFIGFPYGLSEGEAQALYATGAFSRPGDVVYEVPTSPAILMLYDEVLFIMAEAAQRGCVAGDPAQLYQDAIRASMEFWGVTDPTAIEAYIAGVPYDPANWQQVLGEQKWLALYMQGVQGWSEWRRLDFANVLVPPVSGSIPAFGLPIAVRLPFPENERTLNTENVREAVDQFLEGEDDQGTRLWWDVTPPPVAMNTP